MSMPSERRPVRVSDAEREEVVARLGHACGQGRMTLDELAERIDLVYRTNDRDELDELIADLPDRPDLLRVFRRVDDLLADAKGLGITWGELAALLLARSRLT